MDGLMERQMDEWRIDGRTDELMGLWATGCLTRCMDGRRVIERDRSNHGFRETYFQRRTEMCECVIAREEI